MLIFCRKSFSILILCKIQSVSVQNWKFIINQRESNMKNQRNIASHLKSSKVLSRNTGGFLIRVNDASRLWSPIGSLQPILTHWVFDPSLNDQQNLLLFSGKKRLKLKTVRLRTEKEITGVKNLNHRIYFEGLMKT